MEAKWVIQAIDKAKATRAITKPLVMHSDRGVQCTFSAYQEATKEMIVRHVS